MSQHNLHSNPLVTMASAADASTAAAGSTAATKTTKSGEFDPTSIGLRADFRLTDFSDVSQLPFLACWHTAQ